MDIVFRFPHLFSPTSNEVEDAAVLCELVEVLARIDMIYLRQHPRTPSIYQSGIVYGRTDEWLTIPACRQLGFADCKSVSAWRIAELRIRGLRAMPVHRWIKRPDGGKDFHILVQHQTPPMKWEDPSKILGMGKDENAYFVRGDPWPRLRRALAPKPQAAPLVQAASGFDWNAHFRKASGG